MLQHRIKAGNSCMARPRQSIGAIVLRFYGRQMSALIAALYAKRRSQNDKAGRFRKSAFVLKRLSAAAASGSAYHSGTDIFHRWRNLAKGNNLQRSNQKTCAGRGPHQAMLVPPCPTRADRPADPSHRCLCTVCDARSNAAIPAWRRTFVRSARVMRLPTRQECRDPCCPKRATVPCRA